MLPLEYAAHRARIEGDQSLPKPNLRLLLESLSYHQFPFNFLIIRPGGQRVRCAAVEVMLNAVHMPATFLSKTHPPPKVFPGEKSRPNDLRLLTAHTVP